MSGETDNTPAIFIDLGTTNTRVWLAQGQTVIARAQAHLGVRDSARDGSNQRLCESLRFLIDSVLRSPRDRSVESPSCIIGAGMITSSLGLAEVPHVPAPAGIGELAAATKRFDFKQITSLPVFLVPGVRTGSLANDATQADIMRGEETLCLGLLAMGKAATGSVVLNLGSHWKAIRLDSDGRIAGSVTSLAGEMIYAAQTATILASSVSADRPPSLDQHWVNKGMNEQRRSGLARALFCVRLLDLSGLTTPDQRIAFLVGAFIASDMDAILKTGALTTTAPVTLIGTHALTEAWRAALAEAGIASVPVPEPETEIALLAGLQEILMRIEWK